MIYTVECSYADPGSEAQWNDFYSWDKLPALISVSGFQTSQRLRALSTACATYLAVHTVDSLAVLNSAEYALKGGGSFARWQAHITDWYRNLYAADGAALAVRANDVLVVSTAGPQGLLALGLDTMAWQAVALAQTPARRWVAVMARERAAGLGAGFDVYEPMGEQLVCANGVLHA